MNRVEFLNRTAMKAIELGMPEGVAMVFAEHKLANVLFVHEGAESIGMTESVNWTETLTKLTILVESSFCWCETPEGHEYWRSFTDWGQSV